LLGAQHLKELPLQLDLLDNVKARIIACSQVRQVCYVTGETDFVLIPSVADMSEYEQLGVRAPKSPKVAGGPQSWVSYELVNNFGLLRTTTPKRRPSQSVGQVSAAGL
jgi:Lrp/AsnC ligand binding domain